MIKDKLLVVTDVGLLDSQILCGEVNGKNSKKGEIITVPMGCRYDNHYECDAVKLGDDEDAGMRQKSE